VEWFKPSRSTGVPCAVEDIPAVDAVVLSHNQYDHMDADTLKILNARHAPHVFAALANGPVLQSFGYPEELIHCPDWRDGRALALTPPAADVKAQPIDTTAETACPPAHHHSNRSENDRWRTLWAPWTLKAQSGRQVLRWRHRLLYRARGRECGDGAAAPGVPGDRGEVVAFELALLPIGHARHFRPAQHTG
jgi:N-acyl-phosphatidylethanolamine-hydrolysing phospholipase D